MFYNIVKQFYKIKNYRTEVNFNDYNIIRSEELNSTIKKLLKEIMLNPLLKIKTKNRNKKQK